MDLRTYDRAYLPADFSSANIEAIEAVFKELEERPLDTCEQLECWILDWQEITAVALERYSKSYVDMTCDTTSQPAKAEYLEVIGKLLPLLTTADFKLQRRLLSSPALGELDEDFYGTFLRAVRAEVEIYRDENVPLLMEDERLGQEYQEIAGAEQVHFRGETYTVEQIAPFLEETDRATREEAWTARAKAKLESYPKIDELYSRMLKVRREIAANADLPDYRAYAWQAKKRFDYSPEDTQAFHDAIERHVVPLVARDAELRRQQLGVETLRPWDMEVDPEGRPPLRPFGTVDELIDGARTIFGKLDPQLAEFFNYMADNNLLDLGNRPGKGPGGYQTIWYEQRLPFIFMNAVGTRRDVETILHEGGHAFNTFLSRDQTLVSYRQPGPEFAEVASMSMELLARDLLSVFYQPEDIERLHADQLRSILRLFASLAMFDAFQHWVYTNPDHDPEERTIKWAELVARFQPWIDWSGLEQYRNTGWQIIHVITIPFYVIEYAIAQLAALRIWLNARKDHTAALGAYKSALALGGSRPLPDLFTAAGAHFGLDDKTVSELMREVDAVMQKKQTS